MKNIKKASKDGGGAKVINLFKGLALSYGVSLIIFIIYALILTYTDVSESYIPLGAIICTAISCFLGGFAAARGNESGGLFWGAILGLIYTVILVLINILAGAEGGGITSKITMLVCAMASGGVGGILGVNKK